MLTFASLAAALVVPTPLLASRLTLGPPIGSGNFGSVHWARVGDDVAVVKRSLTGVKNANSYLDVEAYANRELIERSAVVGSAAALADTHLAEYLGECTVEGERHLVWRSGGSSTLLSHIESGDALSGLARALGVEDPAGPHGSLQPLGHALMKQLLEVLACVHSCGIVHRDVKPENLLVDERTRSLRLIDFGSACSMRGWLARRGYHASHGPCSTLYCAPEALVAEESPYAFDVYSAAIVWLRCLVPGLRPIEQTLFELRLAIRDHVPPHDFAAWHRAAAPRGELPDGWTDVFTGDESSAQLLSLLDGMLAFDPTQRPSATEALRGPFLNRYCDAEIVPPPPARPWTLKGLQALHGGDIMESDECLLPDADEMSAPLIVIELAPPFEGLELRGVSLAQSDTVQPQSEKLVYVAATPPVSAAAAKEAAGLSSGSPSTLLRVGDALLAVGPIDVRTWEIERVLKLLRCWRAPVARLTFERSTWSEAEEAPTKRRPNLV